ncbi:MAG: YIP1 family protein [Hyphomonadaceae bacterium]|nr:YIP1 family protein [Hyphomonadaceae bacterium]
MTMDALGDGEKPGLIARARDILIRPQSEWRRIAGEEAGSLIGGYVAPLAIAGAVVSFGAGVLYGGGFALNAALASKALSALLYVVFALVSVWLAAIAINALAPRFGAEASGDRARQLAAYASTPILVSMLAAIAPPIAGAVIAAGVIYALVLLAMGMAPLMPLRDPDNNTPRFVISFAALSGLALALAAVFVGPLLHAGREALTGAVETVAPAPAPPPIEQRSVAEVTIDRIAQAEAALTLTDPARLAEQFPDSLPGGFRRQSVAGARRGGISRADSVYRDGTATLSIALIQFGANVDPAAFAALLAVKPDGPQADGYARTQTIDSRFYAEEVGASTSRYVVIGRGVVVVAQGNVTMDQARAAVETIGLQRLEAMFSR